MTLPPPNVALIIPCLNEAKTISSVIEAFRQLLPDIQVYVCDNGSTDGTAALAAANGARVLFQPIKGKGNAVRTLLTQVKADYYLMVDGDATYAPAICRHMLQELRDNKADIVHGVRSYNQGKSSLVRRFGNRFFVGLTNFCLQSKLTDALTGYRAFTREYVEHFPCRSSGFEIETEMNVYTVKGKFRLREMVVDYEERENNAESKLRIIKDGVRILLAILYFSVVCNPLDAPLKRP